MPRENLGEHLGYFMAQCAEQVLDMRSGLVGRRRATHVIAMIEVATRSHPDSEAGFFASEVRQRAAARLRDAHLQPEESKFGDILEWRVDKNVIQAELRSNLMRHLNAPHITHCLHLGLQLHVLLAMYVEFVGQHVSGIALEDFEKFPVLREILAGYYLRLPELAFPKLLYRHMGRSSGRPDPLCYLSFPVYPDQPGFFSRTIVAVG